MVENANRDIRTVYGSILHIWPINRFRRGCNLSNYLQLPDLWSLVLLRG